MFFKLFFVNSETVIIGNYEFSFPVYCLDEIVFKKFEKKALEIGLNIRK